MRVQLTCRCIQGYIRNTTGSCVLNRPTSCWGGAVVSQVTNQCVCILPQVWLIGRCQTVNRCGLNAYWNGYSCACNYGYFLKNGTCTATTNIFECPTNSWFNGKSCTCKVGYFPIQGQCLECPPRTHWNGTGCSNTGLNCAKGFRWNFDKLICEPYN